MPTRSAFFAPVFQIATFEMCNGIALSTMAAGIWRCGFGFWCFFALLMFSTVTFSPSTARTVPWRPLSLPDNTTTWSPLRILFMSKNLGSERHDLHEPLGAQLARDGSEDARADRLELVREQHGGVRVEAQQRAIGTAHAAPGAHDDGVVNLALLDLAARNRVLDGHLDDVADLRIAPARTAEHLDAHQRPGAAVVGGVEHGLQLDHCALAFSTTETSL